MAIFNSYGSHYQRVVSFANSVRFHGEWNNWFWGMNMDEPTKSHG